RHDGQRAWSPLVLHSDNEPFEEASGRAEFARVDLVGDDGDGFSSQAKPERDTGDQHDESLGDEFGDVWVKANPGCHLNGASINPFSDFNNDKESERNRQDQKGRDGLRCVFDSIGHILRWWDTIFSEIRK